MFGKIKRFFIGKPLPNEALHGEKYGVLWGLPILSSDAISSVAYAGEQMLIVLIPAIGALAFGQITILSAVIIGLLALLMLSYRQTIENYPNGGGAFIVAKENIGIVAGVTAGAALTMDYILTVAVSVSSGVQQIASAVPELKPYSVIITVALVLLLMIGNLRGIRESSKLFGLPTYAFVFAMLAMLVTGFIKYAGGYRPPEPVLAPATESLSLFLLLRAFSNGCAAVTGVEAVSNAVPNFKDPARKHAKTVLLLLCIVILVLFGGTALLASLYHAVPGDQALLVMMAGQIFGNGVMYYLISALAFLILILAANTAYSGFPMLISVMAREGYAPRQLNMRGDRLSYTNGIVLLTLFSVILIVAFDADVSKLIGLYAIGVFTSFTLSQSGMFIRWIKHKGRHWVLKAVVNGIGAAVTAVVVVIVAITKFHEGAWIVVIVVPLLVFAMLKVKHHYNAVQKQLRLTPEELSKTNIEKAVYRNRVIVPIESINRSSLRALRFAETISDSVTAFSVVITEEDAAKIKEKFKLLDTDIPLIVKYSPYRKVVSMLLKYIESAEYDYRRGDMITVVVPQFVVRKWWHRLLHNNTRFFIERELLKHRHIVVAVMPLQLSDDGPMFPHKRKKKTPEDTTL